MKKHIIFKTIAITYILNFVWENIQAPLYANYEGFWQHLAGCAVASVADVIIVGLLYILIAVIFKNRFWFRKMNLRHVVMLVVLGLTIAVLGEKIALAFDWWRYGIMPIIPTLNVGLTPVLQMVILPSVIFLCAKKCYNI